MKLERRFEKPEVRELMDRIDRESTPQQKIDRAAACRRMGVECCRAGIRYDHPDWTDDQVRRELIRRILPRDLFRKVYGG